MQEIATFLAENAYVFVVIFTLSLVANILQILSYLRDRKVILEGAEERMALKRALDTYGYVLDRAEKSIRTDDELRSAEASVAERRQLATEIEQRIQAVEIHAKRRLVEEAINRSLNAIQDAQAEVQELRKQHAELAPLPDIPESMKLAIDRDVGVALNRPFELPKALAFRALLLVLFVFLLPYPADLIFTLAFAHLFLLTFFEAAQLHSDPKAVEFVRKHKAIIAKISIFGSWYVALNFVQSLLNPFVFPLLEGRLAHFAANVFPLLLCLLFSNLHWRLISPAIMKA